MPYITVSEATAANLPSDPEVRQVQDPQTGTLYLRDPLNGNRCATQIGSGIMLPPLQHTSFLPLSNFNPPYVSPHQYGDYSSSGLPPPRQEWQYSSEDLWPRPQLANGGVRPISERVVPMKRPQSPLPICYVSRFPLSRNWKGQRLQLVGCAPNELSS
ncbi:hypothetical protein JB92DRAFT_3115364 [Gautieria morchelliformis]|nr:hypothetical protein JB92DRAFT_3115364 [Gautieria morchelliformis]